MPARRCTSTPIALAFGSLMVLPTASIAAEPPAIEKGCRACHGAQGAAPIAPNYPKLNGQNADYLVSALNAYKKGERKGGLAAAMAAQAAQLSDDDIAALAAYYAAQ